MLLHIGDEVFFLLFRFLDLLFALLFKLIEELLLLFVELDIEEFFIPLASPRSHEITLGRVIRLDSVRFDFFALNLVLFVHASQGIFVVVRVLSIDIEAVSDSLVERGLLVPGGDNAPIAF